MKHTEVLARMATALCLPGFDYNSGQMRQVDEGVYSITDAC